MSTCGVDNIFSKELQHVFALANTGKRIRPYVAYLAYQTIQRSFSGVMPLLFALELFHLFALIHDDILDDSPTRHGVQSFHSKFGKDQAILWGDIIFSIAVETMNTSRFSQETRQLFLTMTRETIVGQMLDVADSKELPNGNDFLDHIIELKTSRYTFMYPILLGYSVAGVVNPDQSYVTLSMYLGRAFQKLDDLSDILSPEEVLGKKPCIDIETGKNTHISNYIQIFCPQETQMRFQSYCNRTLSRKERETVRGLAWASGAIENQKENIASDLAEAFKIIQALAIRKNHKEMWLLFVDSLFEKLVALGV